MGDLATCRQLINEYFQRMRITQDDFAGEIGYSRTYFTHVLNGDEKISRKFIERVVEAFAKHEAIKYRSEARELFALVDIDDINPNYWKRPAFGKLKNDDPPESATTEPNKPEEQPTPVVDQAPLAAQSSEGTNLQPSLQTLPAPPQRPKGRGTRRAWVIVCSVVLIGALAGSSFIAGSPLWGLFHKAPITLPAIPSGTERAITCDDLFNPYGPNSTINIATCTPTSDGHATLSFRRLEDKYPELDIKEHRGPSGPNYKVAVRMDLSPLPGSVLHVAGCILMDTSPDVAIGEAVCVYNNGLIEVIDAKTMGSGSVFKFLGSEEVTINDPANVPVIVERLDDNKLYISVANQIIDPVAAGNPPNNIGFMVVGSPGSRGSIKMTALELT